MPYRKIPTSIARTISLASAFGLALATGCRQGSQNGQQPSVSTPTGAAASGPTGSADFSRFVDTYFDSLYAFNPSAGTSAGFHQYDNRLEDYSAASFRRRMATLAQQRAELDTLMSHHLSSSDSIDAAMLAGAIRSELQDEAIIQNWKKNPINYVGLPGNAVDLLMKRDFAPANERLRSVTARLRGVPAVLADMRANVQNPPREFTDLAIRVAGGSVGFFQKDVASWAHGAAGSDTAALRAFTQVNDSVVTAMRQATEWLRTDLLPRSHGSFAIGARNFRDKLLYDDIVDIPLDRLLAIGEANLARDHRDFVATAQQVAPGKSPQEAFATLENDHPTAGDLIPAARATVQGTRQFLLDHRIVDVPSSVMPIVTETPPYARNGSFASMDSPGAYEKKATEAFYYVTPPERSWDPRHTEEHLRLFNKPVISIITVHEVFPGHYLQFLYAPQFPTKTRKLLYASSNVEGWAHYGEQMMVEQGFGNGDPRIRLAQLEEALLRDCRWVVGIREHTQGMSVEEGAKRYFTDRCFQQPANAYEEARRGAYNPTYLYYTLGKLEIYKLRADYQRARGKNFSLREFHDTFVRQGGIPIKLIRQIMLPGDTASVL